MHRRLVSPVALTIVFVATTIFAGAVQAQRRATAPAAGNSIPSPKSVFGFDPGQDRTIIDWKQITDYFARLDKASDRVVGVHMVGPDAGEIMQGIAVAVRAGATKAIFDTTLGIHPTAAEEFVTMRTVTR